ncbi:MAG: hypothetical protein LH702_19330 [Phormidesmis sp. CAN_BIN44]|nr:hypothetical protein [Phormidesmis sp. CAN_BIN44]
MNTIDHRSWQNRVETFRWNVSTPSGNRMMFECDPSLVMAQNRRDVPPKRLYSIGSGRNCDEI